MAAFRLARIVAELGQERAKVIKGKARIASSGNELIEQFFRFAHGGIYGIVAETAASTSIRDATSFHAVESLHEESRK